MPCLLVVAYGGAVNLLTGLVVVLDKARARRGGRRVRERSLRRLGLLGGGAGGLLLMVLVRHKTAKTRFMVPYLLASLMGAAWLGALLWWCWRG